VGSKVLSAEIYSNGNKFATNTSITVVPKDAPQVYTYEIIESYPHDQGAFTQGLEFHGDTLYEGTGQKGASSLRKTNYKTGEVLNSVSLTNEYFGEGITILNDKIYQLTWQKKTGFIYDLSSMEKTGTFVFNKSIEGWGLCNDGSAIYKSDGTEKIWTLNANTLAEEDYIEIYTNKQKIKRVNELEWVDGKIYANIWERNSIAIVDPATGAVEGVINMSGLQKEVTQHAKLDVLNGIAYKGEPNILYVTGKNWDKLFKIRVVKK
jgi:glutamine cyclotransferase